MQKGLSHRISERVRDNRSSRNARNLAAFLAQRDEISRALEDGWTVYQIWETLHAEQKIAASYNTFCNQVKRLILKRAPPASPASRSASLMPSPLPRRAGTSARTASLDGFSFSSTPNDEDIL
ncbi:MAG: TraK family protein [Nitrosospira sp.]|nr:TraK family protein [Nitrosospira sp.]